MNNFTTHVSIEQGFVLAHLDEAYNHDGISYDSNRLDGDEWTFGTAYPAEELPPTGARVEIKGVPFIFPPKEDGFNNNIALEDQRLKFIPEVPQAKVLYILASSDNGDFREMVVLEIPTQRTEFSLPVGFSDWMSIFPTMGAAKGLETSHVHRDGEDFETKRSLWVSKVGMPVIGDVSALRFGYNPSCHVFGVTFGTKRSAQVPMGSKV